MSSRLEVQWRASMLLNKILSDHLSNLEQRIVDLTMNEKTKKIEVEEETENTYRGLRLITGGKPPEDSDWLGDMSPRTVFLVHPKKIQGMPYKGYGLAEFTHGGKFGRAVLLVEDASSNKGTFTWVLSRKFSEEFELAEIIHTPDE